MQQDQPEGWAIELVPDIFDLSAHVRSFVFLPFGITTEQPTSVAALERTVDRRGVCLAKAADARFDLWFGQKDIYKFYGSLQR